MRPLLHAMIERGTIDTIRDRADIVELISSVVKLKRKGNTWSGCCPFHQEKTPSFTVTPSRGRYHCFGCGEDGDVFTFVMKTRSVSFLDAVRIVGDSCGVEVR